MLVNDPVKNLVFEALDRAKENGEDLFFSQPTCIIAIDMVCYESSLEDIDPEVIEPYIELWQAQQAKL